MEDHEYVILEGERLPARTVSQLERIFLRMEEHDILSLTIWKDGEEVGELGLEEVN